MRRRALVSCAVAFVLLAVGAAVEWGLARRLENRFRSSLSSGEGHRGELERVDVCLLCLSYTIHGVDLESAGPQPPAPILSAEEIDVGFDVARLLQGAWQGRIALRGATLHLKLDDEKRGSSPAFAVSWRNLGRGLLPAPVGRIEVESGAVIVHYDAFPDPIEWRFELHSGRAEQLVRAEGAPRVVVAGATPGGGDFEFALEVDGDRSERSTLRGELRSVPLLALESYLRQRLGLEVEGGSMSTRIDLQATDSGWTGHVDCEIVELDVFDLGDLVEEGLFQAAKDGVAGMAITLSRPRDDVLHLRLDVDERIALDEGDQWKLVGRIVQWMILAPFTAPLRLVPRGEQG